MIKIFCKCGNIEDIETEKMPDGFKFKNCDEDTLAIICNRCKESVLITMNLRIMSFNDKNENIF